MSDRFYSIPVAGIVCCFLWEGRLREREKEREVMSACLVVCLGYLSVVRGAHFPHLTFPIIPPSASSLAWSQIPAASWRVPPFTEQVVAEVRVRKEEATTVKVGTCCSHLHVLCK